MVSSLKTCSKCKLEKPLYDYVPSCPTICRDCKNAYQRESRIKTNGKPSGRSKLKYGAAQ